MSNRGRRRSGIRIMASLIGLVRPLLHVMLAAILLGTAVIMIFVMHPQYWKFFLCLAVVAVGVTAVLYYVYHMDPAEVADANFRIQRIRAWLVPYEYEQDTAFQSLQGLYAIGSGGLWGKGLGNSIQKLGKIPELVRTLYVRTL